MRNRCFSIVFVFSLFNLNGYAQNSAYIQQKIAVADSLFLSLKNNEALAVLKQLNSNENAEINYAIACNYFEMQNYDSADYYFNSALNLAHDTAIGFKINVVIKKNNIPKNALQLHKSYKILYEYNRSKAFNGADKLTKANLYYYWLSTSWILKDINESKKYFSLITKTIDSIDVKSLNNPIDKYSLFSFYTKLSTYIITESKNTQLAKAYLQKAEAIFNKSLGSYHKTYNIAIGHYYWQSPVNKNINTSKFWFKKNTLLVPKEQIEYSGAQFMLGKLFYLQDSVQLSIQHFKEAERSVKNILQPHSYNYQVLKWLAAAFAKKGDSLTAARYFILSSNMGDKLNEQNNISVLNTFKFLRDTDAYNIEKDKLEQKHKNESRNLILIICVSLIALLLLSIGFFINKRLNNTLNNQKKRLERALLNNSFLTKEMHHRVKNNLNMISSLLNLQSKQTTNEEAKLILTESKNRIKSVAILHQGLYQNMDDVSGKIILYDYVQRLSNHISHIYKNENKNIQYTVSINENIILGLDTAIPLGLILNEFITNSMKYAFANTSDCEIKISALNKTGKDLTILYEDNGMGFDKNSVKNSFGFSLINLLCGQINATLDLDSDKKTRYTLIINFD